MGHKQQRSFRTQLRTNAADVQVKSLRGQDYMVIPTVMIVEGVLQGMLAATPELALASEFGANPSAWNGCPVPVSHPMRDGTPVSAGTPDVWASEVIGFLFNTQLVDDALCSELWLNKVWAEESGYSDVFNTLESGTIMEVSTGLFTDTVDAQGVWNGLPYRGVWTNCVPDHLALLPNHIGACSVAMGAGTNRDHLSVNAEILSAAQMSSQGQNAQRLMTINQINSKELDMPTNMKPSIFQRILALVAPVKGDAEDRLSIHEQSMRDNLQGINDKDLRTALTTALATQAECAYCYIISVFDDRLVYEYADENYNWVMVQRSYTIDAAGAGTVTLGTDIVVVRPMTSFVPVTVAVEVAAVTSVAELTDATVIVPEVDLSVNITKAERTSATGELIALDRIPAEILAAHPGVDPVEVVAEEAVRTDNEMAEAALIRAQGPHGTPRHNAAALFDSSEQEITEALLLRAQQKDALVAQIIKTAGNQFNADELNAFTIQQLAKMGALQKSNSTEAPTAAVEFAAASGGAVPDVNAGTKFVAPVLAFPRKSSK